MSRITYRDEYGDVRPEFGYTLADAVEKLAHYEDLEEAGKVIEVVRCKDCDNYDTYGCSEGAGWCEAFEIGRFDNGYCDNAKLKELEGGKE